MKQSDVPAIRAEVAGLSRGGVLALGGLRRNGACDFGGATATEGGTNLVEPLPQAHLLAAANVAREQEQRALDEAEKQRQQASVKAQAVRREIQFRAEIHKAEQHLADYEGLKREASLRRAHETVREYRAKQDKEAREAAFADLLREADRLTGCSTPAYSPRPTQFWPAKLGSTRSSDRHDD